MNDHKAARCFADAYEADRRVMTAYANAASEAREGAPRAGRGRANRPVRRLGSLARDSAEPRADLPQEVRGLLLGLQVAAVPHPKLVSVSLTEALRFDTEGPVKAVPLKWPPPPQSGLPYALSPNYDDVSAQCGDNPPRPSGMACDRRVRRLDPDAFRRAPFGSAPVAAVAVAGEERRAAQVPVEPDAREARLFRRGVRQVPRAHPTGRRAELALRGGSSPVARDYTRDTAESSGISRRHASSSFVYVKQARALLVQVLPAKRTGLVSLASRCDHYAVLRSVTLGVALAVLAVACMTLAPPTSEAFVPQSRCSRGAQSPAR